MTKKVLQSNLKKGSIIIYRTKENKTELEVKLEKETVWLNLNQISDLYGRNKSSISRHINNIYSENELSRKSTVANFTTVQVKTSQTPHKEIDQ